MLTIDSILNVLESTLTVLLFLAAVPSGQGALGLGWFLCLYRLRRSGPVLPVLVLLMPLAPWSAWSLGAWICVFEI